LGIEKEITQLTNDNNFVHANFWSKINSDIRKKYRIWKTGNEEVELTDHDYVSVKTICQKYKATTQTVARAAAYMQLKKRTKGMSMQSIRAKNEFIKNGYLDDLRAGFTDKKLKKKYNLSKFKQTQLKKFCLFYK
jgi:hypothetical protein